MTDPSSGGVDKEQNAALPHSLKALHVPLCGKAGRGSLTSYKCGRGELVPDPFGGTFLCVVSVSGGWVDTRIRLLSRRRHVAQATEINTSKNEGG